MSGEVQITVIGNLTADPEMRVTGTGATVANWTLASTPRTYDKASSEWRDGETIFLNCSVWRDQAENVVSSLHKGDRVIAHGVLKSRSYEKDGQKRTVFELDVIEVGPSLLRAEASPVKGGRSEGRSEPPAKRVSRPIREVDPWGKTKVNNTGDPWAS